MSLVLRAARPGDGRRIEEIRVAGWHAAYAGLIDPDWLAAFAVEDRRVASWEDRIAQPTPGSTTLVAEVDDLVRGFSVVLPSRDDDVPDAGELAALYIDPAFWCSGLGSALLLQGLTHLQQDEQVLWVLAGNAPARRFYEWHGFAPDGAHKLLDIGGNVPEMRYRRPRIA